MRSIFFIFLSAISFVVYSQHNNLVVYSETGESFFLSLDKTRQNQLAQSQVIVQELDKTSYKIRIQPEFARHHVISRVINLTNNGLAVSGIEFVYVLTYSKKTKKYELNLKSEAPVVATAPPIAHPALTVNIPKAGQAAPVTPPVFVPDYTGPVGCQHPISQAELDQAIVSIKAMPTEEGKLIKARQVIGSSCLLSAQLRSIMLLLGIENDRLELAKYSYRHTYDIGNYEKFVDIFPTLDFIKQLSDFTSE